MRSSKMICGLLCALAMGLAGAARAATVTFTGADPGVDAGGAFPNSVAARASFAAAADAIATLNTVDFESAPLGSFANLTVAPGVQAGLSNVDASWSGIRLDDIFDVGFNTTSGGSKSLRVAPVAGSVSTASLEFTFATPIVAFGAYLTDTETLLPGTITVTFNDGGTETMPVVKNAAPGVQFIGFIKAGASIVSVRFDETGNFGGQRDIWGLDDMVYAVADPVAPANSVPVPASVWMGGVSMLGLLGWRAWRRRPAAA